jgi:hypothetical protein
MTTPHAQAVLFVCSQLTAAGYTVISANTDEHADPQIFAQSETGELAFYFVRGNAPEPCLEAVARFLALAARHKVAAYYAPVELGPEPSCRAFRPL